MGRLKSGISQIGGKFRLLNTILKHIPIHEFYLEPFLGSGIVLLNKPRCRYECGNDYDSELINYLLIIRQYPKEFDDLKQGVFGLVSQEICNRIVNGGLIPKNNLERAYFFYYLNKLSYGGDYEVKQPVDDSEEKLNFHYCGINNTRALGNSANKRDLEKWKKQFNSSYKRINPKTTRPYTNNDCGLLTPIDNKVINRLRYVNLTAYDFRKVYDLFYKAFHERKGLEKECFVYFDPPYVGTEKYYGNKFSKEFHQELINRIIKSPFNILLSIGGKCEELYVDIFKENGWFIKPVKVKYCTDANSQKDSREYLIMNYDITKIPVMKEDIEQKTMFDF